MPFVCVGGHGCISVLSNVLPAETAAMVEAARDGDLDTARELHQRLTPLMTDLFIQTNPLPVKAALAELGRIEERTAPLVPDPGPGPASDPPQRGARRRLRPTPRLPGSRARPAGRRPRYGRGALPADRP